MRCLNPSGVAWGSPCCAKGGPVAGLAESLRWGALKALPRSFQPQGSEFSSSPGFQGQR